MVNLNQFNEDFKALDKMSILELAKKRDEYVAAAVEIEKRFVRYLPEKKIPYEEDRGFVYTWYLRAIVRACMLLDKHYCDSEEDECGVDFPNGGANDGADVFPAGITQNMVAGFKADIGGSTRPHHGFIDGNEFVLKCGSYSGTSSDDHVHNEYVADCLLRAAGCNVPDSREYRVDIGHGRVEVLRLSKFIKARPLGVALCEADIAGKRKIREQVARTYPVLSFLSAIDSYQHINYDANVLVDEHNDLWFVDNGASFEFSAKGGTAAKPWYWNRVEVLGENGYFALRDARNARGYLQDELQGLLEGVTDEELRREAARYDFVALAKSLPADFLRGNLLIYAENLNTWARAADTPIVKKKVVAAKKGRRKDVLDRITVVTGTIERTMADAIVNAANSVFIGGGGIDGAIHRAAGPRLAAACSDFPRNERGEWCPTGEARTTPAFGIKTARYVIHTAGPDCRDSFDLERNGSELASCYRSVFEEALKSDCKTVAIPSISTGIFGFPFDVAARIATATAYEFLDGHPDLRVIFVMWDGDGKGNDACETYRNALKSYASGGGA